MRFSTLCRPVEIPFANFENPVFNVKSVVPVPPMVNYFNFAPSSFKKSLQYTPPPQPNTEIIRKLHLIYTPTTPPNPTPLTHMQGSGPNYHQCINIICVYVYKYILRHIYTLYINITFK